MKTLLLAVVLIAVVIVPSQARQSKPHEAEFNTLHESFLAAVRANDKEKIADLIAFPVADWSVVRKGNVQTEPIKDRATFLAQYNVLFTQAMRTHALRAKSEALQDGRYMISWHDTDTEYSFEFSYTEGKGFRVTSYSIGPL
jgi:uncharacterized membrane protein YvbJ